MPLFFLDIELHDKVLADRDGGEFPDADAARAAAVKAAQEVMNDRVVKGRPPGTGRVIVLDEARHVVMEVSFEVALSEK